MGDFGLDTHVRGADGSYTATFNADWNIWGPCGGYVAAVAMRAMGEYSAFERPASFACHFLGVGEYRDVDIQVRPLRRAKRAESVALTMSQDGNPILEAVGWAVGDVDGLSHDHVEMPDVARPHELKSVEELLTPAQKEEGPPFNFWNNFDERPLSWLEEDEWMNRPAGDPIFQHWARFRPTARFSDPFTEAARLLVMLDVAMWPAASRGYAHGELNYIAPSLDLSAVFHHIDAASEWLLIDGHSPVAADGIVGGDGRVWSEDGTLLCSGVQSMLCRPMQRPS